jgi:hypothetical protein
VDCECHLIGRWVALLVLAIAALALIFPQFAQRIAGPAVSAGNALNNRSTQTRGMLSAFLAGLGLACFGRPAPGRFWARFSALISPDIRPLRLARC